MLRTAAILLIPIFCLAAIAIIPGCEPIGTGGKKEPPPPSDDTVVQLLKSRDDNAKLKKENDQLISKLDMAENKAEQLTIRNGKLEKVVSGLELQIRQLKEQLTHFKGLPAERDNLAKKVDELTRENLKLMRENESLKKKQ